jgi:hypothetical protein
MSEIQIDISDQDEDESPVGIAVDVPGNCFDILVGSLKLTVNYEQLTRLYQQIRPWFEDETE